MVTTMAETVSMVAVVAEVLTFLQGLLQLAEPVCLAEQDQQAPQAVWPVQQEQHLRVDRVAQKVVDLVPVEQVAYNLHIGNNYNRTIKWH
jgi:hypothetical protein